MGSILTTEILRNDKNVVFHRKELGTLIVMHCIIINSVKPFYLINYFGVFELFSYT